MKSNVAHRYAKALLSITKQKGSHAKALHELQVIEQALHSDPSLKNYFDNPGIPGQQKIDVIKAAFAGRGLSEEVLSTLLLLTERGRLPHFQDVVSAFKSGIDEDSGVTRGVVRAAKPISSEAQAELEKKITQVLKKKIVLTFKEDSSLLGGVIAEVGGWTFDDSIETHLKKMKEELNRRAY